MSLRGGSEGSAVRAPCPIEHGVSETDARASEVDSGDRRAEVRAAVGRARAAGERWRRRSLEERSSCLASFRRRLSDEAPRLARILARRETVTPAEALVCELVPLADACRFLEREAPRLLAPRRLGRRGRPLWLSGVDLEVRREPFGVVLVLGPSNYPLFLPGTQTLQALAAGNAVVLKPGRGGGPIAEALRSLLEQSGVEPSVVEVLDEDDACGELALEADVDKVVLTGSSTTGRAVLRSCAESLVPAVVELSGCDDVFVLEGADLDLVARAIAFGTTLNGGATCIAPRRVWIDASRRDALTERLEPLLREHPAAPVPRAILERLEGSVERARAAGTRILGSVDHRLGAMRPLLAVGGPVDLELRTTDIFAPVVSVIGTSSLEEAVSHARRSPYALGAAVFGEPEAARKLALELDAGVVVINDLVVPTADPRLPFGGRGESGYGVTRGAEGLLEMTRVRSITERRGGRLDHLAPPTPHDEELFASFLSWSHARGSKTRLGALLRLVRAALARWRHQRTSRGPEAAPASDRNQGG